MKLCLLLLLGAAGFSLASPVPRVKKGRNILQEYQGRLLPIAIFHNGVTTTTTTVAPAAAVKAVLHSADGGAPVAAQPAQPTRNIGSGLQPISVDDLPPVAELADILNQQPACAPGFLNLPNPFAGLADWFNGFRFLGRNNIANTASLSNTAALNQATAGGGTQPRTYVWSPTTGAVPYNTGNRKRVNDEPEQIDPNYLKLLQELYYSSRQNLQQSSYFPPQFSDSIAYQTPIGYTKPIPIDNPSSQQRLAAHQPHGGTSYYQESPVAINPYYPVYLISNTPNFEANGISQNLNNGAGLETVTQFESEPGTIDQNTAVKIQIENDEAKPEIVVQETAVKSEIENKDSTENKPETEMKTTSGSKREEVPNQNAGTQQSITDNKEIHQQAGEIARDINSNHSEPDNQSEPSNVRENSKFYVKFSRDPSTQQRRVYQEHQSRSDVPPGGNGHGQLVSSYRLQHTSAP